MSILDSARSNYSQPDHSLDARVRQYIEVRDLYLRGEDNVTLVDAGEALVQIIIGGNVDTSQVFVEQKLVPQILLDDSEDPDEKDFLESQIKGLVQAFNRFSKFSPRHQIPENSPLHGADLYAEPGTLYFRMAAVGRRNSDGIIPLIATRYIVPIQISGKDFQREFLFVSLSPYASQINEEAIDIETLKLDLIKLTSSPNHSHELRAFLHMPPEQTGAKERLRYLFNVKNGKRTDVGSYLRNEHRFHILPTDHTLGPGLDWVYGSKSDNNRAGINLTGYAQNLREKMRIAAFYQDETTLKSITERADLYNARRILAHAYPLKTDMALH